MTRSLKTLALFARDPPQPQCEAPFRGAYSSHLWLAAYFPKRVLEFSTGACADRATVVVEDQNGCTRVIAANERAVALGIKPDIKLSAAFALSDSLDVLMRCAEAERLKLQELAKRARRFTPVVSLEPPSALLMEVGGSLKLFGGIGALKRLLLAELEQRQFTVHLCAAPTAMAALWLARCAEADVLSREELPGRLGRLPITATAWPQKTRALLKSMGARTLGDCMRLPRDGFARRIGPEYLSDMDKLLGGHDLRQEFEPILRLSARCEFANEISGRIALMNAGKRLIGNIVADLRRLQVQIQRLECIFHYPDSSATVEEINFAEPTQDEERLLRLFMDRMEQIRLHAPAAALSIKTGPAEPVHIDHETLFAGLDDLGPRSTRAGLIERLQARFGVENLYGMALVEEHRPETAWVRSRQSLSQQGRHAPLIVERPQQRPLWMLRAPQPLPSTADDLPCYRDRDPLRLESDPERIESGWWDGNEIDRDYYVASSNDGERLWGFSRSLGWASVVFAWPFCIEPDIDERRVLCGAALP